MADAKMLNRAKVLARLRSLPTAVQIGVGSQLAKEVEDLTEAIQRAAPVDGASREPGELRDSVHFYPTPDRPLSYRVLADAKDESGDFIGSHVEAGHRTADGEHVPASPFFFPTYRARKKPMRRRLSAAATKAAKADWESS
jgi:hypothetical protein